MAPAEQDALAVREQLFHDRVRECIVSARGPAAAVRGVERGKGPGVAAGEGAAGRGWEPAGPSGSGEASGVRSPLCPTPGPYRCQSRGGLPCAPQIAGSRG